MWIADKPPGSGFSGLRGTSPGWGLFAWCRWSAIIRCLIHLAGFCYRLTPYFFTVLLNAHRKRERERQKSIPIGEIIIVLGFDLMPARYQLAKDAVLSSFASIYIRWAPVAIYLFMTKCIVTTLICIIRVLYYLRIVYMNQSIIIHNNHHPNTNFTITC